MPETNTGKPMSTERGGEQTQYEGAVTENVPTEKATGQLGAGSQHSTEKQPSVSKEHGERVAANMRYGQAISEQGVGGKTTTSSGEAQQGGYGGASADKRQEDIDAAASRRSQGYGPGSGVGA